MLFAEKLGITSSSEHGFRKGKSTVTAMSDIIQDIILAFENKDLVILSLPRPTETETGTENWHLHEKQQWKSHKVHCWDLYTVHK